MDTALAQRHYTLTQVKPAITRRGRSARATIRAATKCSRALREAQLRVPAVFRPQIVPAYSAIELFLELRKKYPDYLYKEATLNPTNQRNRAVDWEEDLIKEFRNRPELAVFDGERDTPFGRAIYLAKPMRVEKACLECHSIPSVAPKEMVQAYGASNGFAWKEGEILTAQIVSVPLSVPLQMATSAFRRMLVSLIGVGVLTLLVLDASLYVTVIRSVGRFAVRADEISKVSSNPRARGARKDGSRSSPPRSTACTAVSPSRSHARARAGACAGARRSVSAGYGRLYARWQRGDAQRSSRAP
jgi:protein-histidine pros-kinase